MIKQTISEYSFKNELFAYNIYIYMKVNKEL